ENIFERGSGGGCGRCGNVAERELDAGTCSVDEDAAERPRDERAEGGEIDAEAELRVYHRVDDPGDRRRRRYEAGLRAAVGGRVVGGVGEAGSDRVAAGVERSEEG